MIDKYFEWLCAKIGIKDVKKSDYKTLLIALYLKKFYFMNPMDDNRAEDGKELRLLYLEEEKLPKGTSVPDEQCRLLELFVGFAMRIERDILHDDKKGDRTSKWFWEMMKNLGLEYYRDSYILGEGHHEAEIDHILDVFLDRKYQKNGKGGLFPLRHTKKNQREVELWYQMVEYCNENWV